jgi:hypothetical protein
MMSQVLIAMLLNLIKVTNNCKYKPMEVWKWWKFHFDTCRGVACWSCCQAAGSSIFDTCRGVACRGLDNTFIITEYKDKIRWLMAGDFFVPIFRSECWDFLWDFPLPKDYPKKSFKHFIPRIPTLAFPFLFFVLSLSHHSVSCHLNITRRWAL